MYCTVCCCCCPVTVYFTCTHYFIVGMSHLKTASVRFREGHKSVVQARCSTTTLPIIYSLEHMATTSNGSSFSHGTQQQWLTSQTTTIMTLKWPPYHCQKSEASPNTYGCGVQYYSSYYSTSHIPSVCCFNMLTTPPGCAITWGTVKKYTVAKGAPQDIHE